MTRKVEPPVKADGGGLPLSWAPRTGCWGMLRQQRLAAGGRVLRPLRETDPKTDPLRDADLRYANPATKSAMS
jgi:hypothetical protein